MIGLAHDEASALLVLFAWGTALDEDFRVFRQALIELDRSAVEQRRVPVTILRVVEGAQRPSAEQRRTIAETWSEMAAPHHVFALVTTSAMARGIFKVINWLNPPASRRRESVHSTLEQALEWVEQERPDAVPALRVLYERAGQGARGA